MKLRLALLLALFTSTAALFADEEVVVRGREEGEEFEEPGGYGQPQWAERSRASATTKLYVLSPWEVFAGVISSTKFGRGRGELTQEIELGLPGRLELDLENRVGYFAERDCSLGARYALANWGKLPLNPALAASYRFGEPRALELRLLLGQEFFPRVQWAANLFADVGRGGRGARGFTQSLAYLALADRLELGTELRLAQTGHRNEFGLGPSVNWKPNLHTVLSAAPLFGLTHRSPRLELLLAASLEFGGGESKTAR